MTADDNDGRSPTRDDDHTSERTATGPPPRLGSRVLLTWLELTVVGITGGILGATIGGPPGFVVYLTTTLLSVGIVFHNVNELIKGWVRATRADRLPETTE